MKVDVAKTPEAIGKYRVLLDGEDVTDDCFEADDASGWVGIWLTNADGSLRIDGGEPAFAYRHGRVEITRK